jgi:hypothetical protein
MTLVLIVVKIILFVVVIIWRQKDSVSMSIEKNDFNDIDGAESA